MDIDPEVGPEKLMWSTAEAWTDLPNLGFSRDKFYRPSKLIGDMIPYTGSCLAIDPSGRGKDETAWAVVKYLNGYLYLVDWGGSSEGFTEPVMRSLATVAKKYQVNVILTEKNYGGGMFAELLRPHLRDIYPCTIEEIQAKSQKEKRIADCLEPVMNQHRLCVNASGIRKDYESTLDKAPDVAAQYSLIHQMSHLTRERGSLDHDDRLDAVTMAVEYWVESMARDADAAIRERKEEWLEDQLDKMFDVLNRRSPNSSQGWFDFE